MTETFIYHYSDDLPKQKLKVTVTDSLRKSLAKLKETSMAKMETEREGLLQFTHL